MKINLLSRIIYDFDVKKIRNLYFIQLIRKEQICRKRKIDYWEKDIYRSDISMIAVTHVSAISSMSCSRHCPCESSTDGGTTIAVLFYSNW